MNDLFIPLVLSFTLVVLFICLLLLSIVLKRLRNIEKLFEKPLLLTVGSEAPHFVAETIDKQRVTLHKWTEQEVTFVFLDFSCEICKKELPEIEILNATSSTRFVLATDDDIDLVRSVREALSLRLPIIVAPRFKYDFLRKYNPYRLSPYFCAIDPTGKITAIGYVGKEEWLRQKAKWGISAKLKSTSPQSQKVD